MNIENMTEEELAKLEDKIYKGFISGILEQGFIWTLHSEDQDSIFAISEGQVYENDVMVCWVNENEARKLGKLIWPEFQPRKLDLDEILNAWLPFANEHELMIGPDWKEDAYCLEVEPFDVLEDLGGDVEQE